MLCLFIVSVVFIMSELRKGEKEKIEQELRNEKRLRKERKGKVYVQIDWIRHGFSCSNALSSLKADTIWSVITEWEFKRHKYAKDAKLTDLGIAQAQVANRKFFGRHGKFDMICCSQLRRAMETAKEVFNGIDKPIYVLPYVNEHRSAMKLIGMDAQTVPTDWEVRRAEVGDRFNWLFFETLGIKKFVEPSGDKFYRRLLPLLIYFVNKGRRVPLGTSERPIRLAIVSHQLFIRDILDIEEGISNTGIWTEKFSYDMKKRSVEKRVGKKAIYKPEYIVFNGRKIVYGDKGKIEGKYLKEEAISRCGITDIVKFDY